MNLYHNDGIRCNSNRTQGKLEKIEKLEQLRILEAGHRIVVGVVDEPTFGIDTPEDYRTFVDRYRQSTFPR